MRHAHFFEEIKVYVGFGRDEEARLRQAHAVIAPHISAIVGVFYDALSQNPRTRAVLVGPEQIQRLHYSLEGWLDGVFTGPWDTAYFERRMRIGQVHVDVGLLPHFMFGAMTTIRVALLECMRKSDLDPADAAACSDAIDKVLDLELTIMLQSYWDTMMDLKLKVPLALATGMAHEIRNPLNAVGLNLTLLERQIRGLDGVGEQVSPILESIRGEIRRIYTLTSEMMDFAKPVVIQPTWNRADRLFQELEAMHGATFDAAQITFETGVIGDPYIWCDLDRMKQVFVNLLQNAVEAMENPGTICLTVTNDDSGTHIVVSDDGEGMEPALRYRVFDIFFTNKASGTGLGLPIVKNIIESHNGAIDVTSKVGVGTTFDIYLPRPPRYDHLQEERDADDDG